MLSYVWFVKGNEMKRKIYVFFFFFLNLFELERDKFKIFQCLFPFNSTKIERTEKSVPKGICVHTFSNRRNDVFFLNFSSPLPLPPLPSKYSIRVYLERRGMEKRRGKRWMPLLFSLSPSPSIQTYGKNLGRITL